MPKRLTIEPYLSFAPSALYLLAATSTPEAAVKKRWFVLEPEKKLAG